MGSARMTTEVAELVPWLHATTIVPLAGGWTCETYVVNDAWIVQVGRTDYAASSLRHQSRTLPRLASYLGARNPNAKLACDSPTTIVYRRLDGVRSDAAAAGGPWPEQFGKFLSRLHAIPPSAVGLEVAAADTLRSQHRDLCRHLLTVVASRLDETGRGRAERNGVVVSRRGCELDLHPDRDPRRSRSGARARLGWWLGANEPAGERILSSYTRVLEDRFLLRARHAYALAPWHAVAHGVATRDDAMITSGIERVRALLM
jgi:hypothetical protein